MFGKLAVCTTLLAVAFAASAQSRAPVGAVYGKDATAYYDLHNGLRWLKRGTDKTVAVPCEKNDTFVEELEEFAAAVRGQGQPEVGGDYGCRSLAVVRAGILSAREGRKVEVEEILRND